MHSSKKALAVPILIMALGCAWLLKALNIIPGVDWIWIIGLGGLGILVLALGGWNRLSVVVGGMLLVSSAFSLIRQMGYLTSQVEVPCLIIVFGGLLLFVQLANVPMPDLKEGNRGP